MILALIANANRDQKRRSEPFSPDDFNPFAVQRREEPIARVGVDMLRRLFIDGNGVSG